MSSSYVRSASTATRTQSVSAVCIHSVSSVSRITSTPSPRIKNTATTENSPVLCVASERNYLVSVFIRIIVIRIIQTNKNSNNSNFYDYTAMKL